MTQETLSLLESWEGDGAVVRFDRPTGTWIFIGLHDSTLGRPAGGTRMKVYPSPADGLFDALRLAEGMTYKWAGLGMDKGGGKAVLAVPRPVEGEELTGLLHRYGALVETLGGTFNTGADLGMGPERMRTVAQKTQYVLGIDYDTMASHDPGPYTAHGVFCGIKATLRQAFGTDDLHGRAVLVQGVGDVGEPLARSLAEGGAWILVSDVDRKRAAELAGQLGGEVIDPEQVYTTPCDVYAPCAIGATVNRATVPRLACRIIAGSANNQLLEDADAERLHGRGILYAPDYLLNAGGAMAISLMKDGLRDEAALMTRVEGIGDTIEEILQQAAESGTNPLVAAKRRVERVLAKSYS